MRVAEPPSIKAASDTYGKDPRFRMFSIGLEEKSDDAKYYPQKTACPGTRPSSPAS